MTRKEHMIEAIYHLEEVIKDTAKVSKKYRNSGAWLAAVFEDNRAFYYKEALRDLRKNLKK